MSWQQWTLIAWYALGILATVGTIGKPRKPIDPDLAVVMIVVQAGLIALVVTG